MQDLAEIYDLLRSKRSPDRRRAAKKCRKERVIAAAPAVLVALEAEVRDPRTWETQYQMIMALGESGYVPALPLLRRLAATPLENTMVYTGLGDAIVRLTAGSQSDAAPALTIMRERRHDMLVDGAFRAMAMLKLVPAESDQKEIIRFVVALPHDHHLRFWVAAAAVGWSPVITREFFEQCLQSGRVDLREAAALGMSGKYKKWNPL